MQDQAAKVDEQQTIMDVIMSRLQELHDVSIDIRCKAWEIMPRPPTTAEEAKEKEEAMAASGKIVGELKEMLTILQQARDALNEFV